MVGPSAWYAINCSDSRAGLQLSVYLTSWASQHEFVGLWAQPRRNKVCTKQQDFFWRQNFLSYCNFDSKRTAPVLRMSRLQSEGLQCQVWWQEVSFVCSVKFDDKRWVLFAVSSLMTRGEFCLQCQVWWQEVSNSTAVMEFVRRLRALRMSPFENFLE
jgi:hypothetical protein